MIDEKLVRHAEATLRKIIPYRYNVSAEEVEDAYRVTIEAIKRGGQIVWWRKVEDELPPVGEDVLVCYDYKGKKSVYIASYYGDGEFHGLDDEYLTADGRKYRKAIAWMPLPRT